jgi:hypothetical protein
MVIVFSALTGGHFPLPVVVRVSTALPPEISDEEGVYVAFNVVAEGENVPAPVEVQTAPPAFVMLPFSNVEGLLAHTVVLPPEFAVGGF